MPEMRDPFSSFLKGLRQAGLDNQADAVTQANLNQSAANTAMTWEQYKTQGYANALTRDTYGDKVASSGLSVQQQNLMNEAQALTNEDARVKLPVTTAQATVDYNSITGTANDVVAANIANASRNAQLAAFSSSQPVIGSEQTAFLSNLAAQVANNTSVIGQSNAKLGQLQGVAQTLNAPPPAAPVQTFEQFGTSLPIGQYAQFGGEWWYKDSTGKVVKGQPADQSQVFTPPAAASPLNTRNLPAFIQGKM